MACSCNCEPPEEKPSQQFRVALWIALLLNISMFVVELIGGSHAHSSSLWADSLDFLGDAINYGVSLAVLGLSLYWRATVAFIKGLTMILFGFIIMIKTTYSYVQGIPPEAITMGMIGILALVANVLSAVVLYAFRNGDSNMQSVWLCSRNDAIGNIAVILAAIGTLGTSSILPDLLVATIMVILSVTAGISVVRKSLMDLRKNKIIKQF